MENKTALYSAFSEVRLDIHGSNISNTGCHPLEEDKKWMTAEEYENAQKEAVIKDEKVIFKNLSLGWDSCDCEYEGCGHGQWVYEIRINTEDQVYMIEVDEDNLYINHERKTGMIPIEGATIFDFYHMCQIVGIELELTPYGHALILDKINV